MTGPLDVSKLLKEYDLLTMDSLSKYVLQQMNLNSKMFDCSTQTVRDESDEFSLDEDNEEDDERSVGSSNGNISSDDQEGDKDDELETV
jgi:hypothetical protein